MQNPTAGASVQKTRTFSKEPLMNVELFFLITHAYEINTLDGSSVVCVEPNNRVSQIDRVPSNPLLQDKNPQTVKEPLKNLFIYECAYFGLALYSVRKCKSLKGSLENYGEFPLQKIQYRKLRTFSYPVIP